MYVELFEGSRLIRASTCASRSRPATTRWSWCATYPSRRYVSTTSFPSRALRTSPTCPVPMGASRAVQDGPARRGLRPTTPGPRAHDHDIVEAMERELHPKGTIVVIEAEHFCMSMRA